MIWISVIWHDVLSFLNSEQSREENNGFLVEFGMNR